MLSNVSFFLQKIYKSEIFIAPAYLLSHSFSIKIISTWQPLCRVRRNDNVYLSTLWGSFVYTLCQNLCLMVQIPLNPALWLKSLPIDSDIMVQKLWEVEKFCTWTVLTQTFPELITSFCYGIFQAFVVLL